MRLAGNQDWPEPRVLVVDDEAPNVLLLEKILKLDGYVHVKSTRDSREVAALVEVFSPDILLLDLQMPHLDGHAVLEQLKDVLPVDVYLPVLVLTADISLKAKEKALSNGAHDFLTKPFEPLEVILRMRNLLSARFLHQQLREQNTTLETKVQERTQELKQASYEILHRLARAAEFRDDDTGQHTLRVGNLSAQIGIRLGMAAEEAEMLQRAAALHDVGKIGISDTILLKPGRLTPAEFEVMKEHTRIGAGILAGSNFPMLQMAEQIALHHHERWNGSGYPNGLAGEEIPLCARIVAIVDVYDALTNERPYKKAWPVSEAVAEITKMGGTHFDPQVLKAFLSLDVI